MSSSGQGPAVDGRKRQVAAVPAASEKVEETGEVSTAPAKAKPNGRRRLVVLLVVVALATAGLVYYLHARNFEETDDAQIDGNISAVGPRVKGTVTATRVVENQSVKVGDVLVELDPTDLAVAVDQAKAGVAQAAAQLQVEDPSIPITETSNVTAVASASSELASASAGLSGSQKDVDQATARLVAAEGNARLAELERQRGEDLLKAQAIPRSDVDKRVTTAVTAAADVQAAQQALAAAREKVAQQRAQLGATKSRLSEVKKNAPRQVATRRASVLYRQANLDLAKAQLAQAELNLGYAKILSPVAGVVAKKAVTVGDHVAPGQQLLAIAQIGVLWVTANFRETQLERIAIGQPVEMHVDALSADLTGKVESLGGTTGSRLSVLPPENASGNYVKVVQRIPVRIRLDPGQPGLDRLRPGMSAVPKIRVTP
jgi:membrane fusion protein, multidrug efflux system